MNTFSRKDFLRLTSLTLLANFLPTEKINAFAYILDLDKNTSQTDFERAVELSKLAKIQFYKKAYKQAEELYKQCITLAPKAIRFYDGLENVFGAQGRFLEALLLYKNGLTINDKNVAFYDRTARALMRVEIGSKKLAKEYRTFHKSNSMLNDALALYEKALLIDGSKNYLLIGKKKIEDKIALKATDIDFRKASEYKRTKKERANKLHAEYAQLPIEKLTSYFNSLDTKKRLELYHLKDKQIRERNILYVKKKICSTIFDNYYKAKDYSNAEIWASKMFYLDNSDQHALVRFKRSLFKQKKYKEIIGVRLAYAKRRENVFSYLGVLDAIELAHKNKQADSSDFELAHEIGSDLLKNWGLIENNAIDVIVKYNKILIVDNKFDLAYKITENALLRINTSNEERINTILHSYATLFKSQGHYKDAIKILQVGLKQEVDSSNVNFKYDLIQQLSNRKIDNSFNANKSLYCLLYYCYKDLGNAELASTILNIFRDNNPEDSFLSNKI